MPIGIAFCRGRREDDWLRKLIRFVTAGPFTHVAIYTGWGRLWESHGRHRYDAGVRLRSQFDPNDPDWQVIWFSVAPSQEREIESRCMRLSGRPFHYRRVVCGLFLLLLGERIAQWAWKHIRRETDALDCTEFVHAVCGGIGWPVASSPNELYRRLIRRGVSIHARQGGFEE